MDIRHIIFDCDGVLVDSEPLSMRADVTLLSRHGIRMTPEEAGKRFIGKTFEAMLVEMAAEHGTVFPPGLSAEKDALLETLFRTDLKPVAGMATVLAELAERGLAFSVASNSPRQRVELALELTGLGEFFSAITTFEDVARGKPAPDVYVEAVRRADMAPSECLVIEDSTTGVRSAVAAGLATFAFTGTHHEPMAHASALRKLGAARSFNAMSELPGLVR